MRPKEVLMAWHQAFVQKDIQALSELYAEDAINHQTPEAPVYGKDAIEQSFLNFFEVFPNERTEILNIFEDGEWAIWEWIGGPEDKVGSEFDMHGCGFFQIREGKIILQRGYWDKITFLKTHNLSLD